MITNDQNCPVRCDFCRKGTDTAAEPVAAFPVEDARGQGYLVRPLSDEGALLAHLHFCDPVCLAGRVASDLNPTIAKAVAAFTAA